MSVTTADNRTPTIGQGPVGGWLTVNGKKVRSKQTKAERRSYLKRTRAARGKRNKARSLEFLEKERLVWENMSETPQYKRCTIVLNNNHDNLEVNILGQIRYYDTKLPVTISIDVGGYLIFGNRDRTVSVHRCVLETFRTKPLCYLQCDHINANPADNRKINLRWVTSKLNNVFKPARGYNIRICKSFTSYQTKFRKKSYGTFKTPQQARARYDDIRNDWMKSEKQRIVDAVIKKNECSTKLAKQILNWGTI